MPTNDTKAKPEAQPLTAENGIENNQSNSKLFTHFYGFYLLIHYLLSLLKNNF